MKIASIVSLLFLVFVPLQATANETDATRLFERLKALEGKWRIAEPARDTEVSFKVMSNGSALVETWQMSATRSSITIYVLDGERLIVTHYCPQGNAPRLAYVDTDKKSGVHRFEFLDGTNLQDRDGSHQHAFWMRFVSDDAFIRTETYIKNGEKFEPEKVNDSPQTFVRDD